MLNNLKAFKLVYSIIIISVILIQSYFVSIRNDYIGTDTLSYKYFFYNYSNSADTRISEPIFLLITKITTFLSMSHYLFFFVISVFSGLSLVYFGLFLYKVLGLSGNRKALIFVSLIIFLNFLSPFYINGQINIIRASLSIPFVFFGLLMFYIKNYKSFFIMFFIAVSLHFSSIIFIPATFIILFGKKQIFRIIILMSILYTLGLPKYFFEFFSSYFTYIDGISYYEGYGNENSAGVSGVRYDFLIFSLVFFFIAYAHSNKGNIYDFLFKAYSALLLPFLFFGFISYSDRLLYAAWVFLPFIIAGILVFYIKKPVFTYIPFLYLIFIGFSLFLYNSRLL